MSYGLMFFEVAVPVDELLWKGARGAPMVQRIGVVVFALAYLIVAVTFISSLACRATQLASRGPAAILLGIGGWFIRNALRK